jgi:multidrug efflux system membrane fusion protein
MSVESRPVVPGMSVGDDIVIDKGLAAGEQVVTEGQLRLVPGAKVQPSDS